MIYAFKVDVTAIGLDEMREYPELGALYIILQSVKLTRYSTSLWYNMLSVKYLSEELTIRVGLGPCLDEHSDVSHQAQFPVIGLRSRTVRRTLG